MTLPCLFESIADVRQSVAAARSQGKRVGFVPTMGALHEGHASLIRAARAESGYVVVSIFVNPTQFGPNEDYSRYPRTLDSDRALCREAGADAIFLPDGATMYPPGFVTYVEPHGLQDVLCGASRPGHFRGVCTVVLKLFHIVQPDLAYFGQKDAQQALILTRMVADLNLAVTMRVMPTVRESDGLALSSRNKYLSAEERRQAPSIYRALLSAKSRILAGERDTQVIEQYLADELRAIPAAMVDYARAVGAATLQPVQPLRGNILIAVAVRLGDTRLIDNILLDVPA